MMIVCVKCGKFFHPKKNGVYVEEGMPAGNGERWWEKDADEDWKPYKLWRADLIECRNCGAEVIAGFARAPVREHFMPDYAAYKAQVDVRVFVKDCI